MMLRKKKFARVPALPIIGRGERVNERPQRPVRPAQLKSNETFFAAISDKVKKR